MRRRLSGLGFILLAVLLGSGGVTVRSTADEAFTPSLEYGWSPLEDGQMSLADEPEGICTGLAPTRRHARIELPHRDSGDVIFSLDASGYNYPRPGEHRPAPPASVTR